MRKLLQYLSVAIALTLTIDGCSSKDPAFPTAPSSGLLRIENGSSHEIAIFRYRPTGSSEWGINNITRENKIPPGFVAEYYLPPGQFDIRLENESATIFWTRQGLNAVTIVQDETYTLPITD
jgi:hypothetical protein